MQKVNISELSGPALDWCVAKCEGLEIDNNFTPIWFDSPGWMANRIEYSPSTDWVQGGPIIERECMSVLDANGCFGARKTYWDNSMASIEYFGQTPLIAAMRCFVASKLGQAVEVPEELL